MVGKAYPKLTQHNEGNHIKYNNEGATVNGLSPIYMKQPKYGEYHHRRGPPARSHDISNILPP
jgi:hypothetical protein